MSKNPTSFLEDEHWIRASPGSLEQRQRYSCIFKGTITRSYGVQHKLYRGVWDFEGDPFDSYNYYNSSSSGSNPSEGDNETVSVAVKTIHSSDDDVIDLTREASSLRILQGTRNVASVYGVTRNREMQSVCIVMELVQGPDLNSFLRSGKPSSCSWSWWKTKLEIFMELVIGLSVCHQRGIYHGDLKGKNVLVDEFMVPKLIDFGFSFRKKDVDYLRSLGGSPFWISPELDEAVDEIPPEVLANPFPSDVYSLGMVLVEMIIDGEIPEYIDSVLVMNKYMGGSPIELQVPEGMEDLKESVFDEIFAVVDGCCSAERDDRISLKECLVHIRAAYSNLCSSCKVSSSSWDEEFTSSKDYTDMLAVLQARFPEVPDAIARQPAKNMMVDIQGTLLVDLFCQLDFKLGVEFVIDKAAWDFDPKKAVPRLCHICVKAGSHGVLKFLGERWRAIVAQEEWLMHDACEGDSLEVLQVLLEDINMEFDTWPRSGQLKPFHKLAFHGKMEMMKLLLDKASTIGDYVNATVNRKSSVAARPLNYAIQGDKVEAVFFLIEHGGVVTTPRDYLDTTDYLEQLFYCAVHDGSLSVATSLLEISYFLKTGNGGSMKQISSKVLERFENHEFGCLDYFGHEFRDHEYVLALLRGHLVESGLRGMEPLRFACSKEGNAHSQEVFQMMVSFCNDDSSVLEDKLWKLLGGHGSKEMAAYAMEKISRSGHEQILEAAIDQGNLEVVDFLKAAEKSRDGEESDQVKDEGDGKEDEELDDSELSSSSEEPKINEELPDLDDDSDGEVIPKKDRQAYLLYDVCEAVVQADIGLLKRKLPKLCLDGRSFVEESWEPGIGMIQKVEDITKKAGIWKTLAPELLKRFAYAGSSEMVLHLLEKGVPVDGPDYTQGWITQTPLMIALSGSHFETAEIILLAGANPNTRRKAGYSSMDIALGMNNRKMVRLLIRFGFDTGSKNRDNETYMDLIAHLED
ncbi:uncharacterized protein LOC112343566 [Selaginella moellendorffii]|nr:uncharacterized protein LOC112343566 [Selaginella moellendorffii]|eukprot:XP_024523020.1 uncharacterized protein LOC112343566 [Selaginella moellendorffii]